MGCQSSSSGENIDCFSKDDHFALPSTLYSNSKVILSQKDLPEHDVALIKSTTTDSKQNESKTILYVKTSDSNLDLTQHEILQPIASIESSNALENMLRCQEILSNDYIINFAGKSKKGFVYNNSNKPNQDCIGFFSDDATETLIWFVMDGHGQFGHEVTKFCSNFLMEHLVKHPLFLSDIQLAVNHTVLIMDEQISLNEKTIDTNFSGTTLVLLTIRNGKILVANVGDSRAIVIQSEDNILQITNDHKASIPEEYARIVGNKGKVLIEPSGLARIYLTNSDIPGLAMSRSIGDTKIHKVGVIANPEFHYIEMKNIFSSLLPNNDKGIFLILGTDGIFDVITNEFLAKYIYTNDNNNDNNKCYKISNQIELIINESVKNWMELYGLSDDISLIAINICKIDTPLSPSYEEWSDWSI